MNLEYLPLRADWPESFADAKTLSGAAALRAFRILASSQLSFPQLGRLDRAIAQALQDPDSRASLPTVRIAIIGSATTSHLPPAIRVAALRRGLIADVYEGDYGMYMQELASEGSALRAFRPDALLNMSRCPPSRRLSRGQCRDCFVAYRKMLGPGSEKFAMHGASANDLATISSMLGEQ